MKINNVSYNTSFKSYREIVLAQNYITPGCTEDQELVNEATKVSCIKPERSSDGDYLWSQDSIAANHFIAKCATSKNRRLAAYLLRSAYLDNNITSVLTKEKYQELIKPMLFDSTLTKDDALKAVLCIDDDTYQEILETPSKASSYFNYFA